MATDMSKYMQQIERKREYNRNYYKAKVKPKRQAERRELENFRQKRSEPEDSVAQMDDFQTQIEDLQAQIEGLQTRVQDLQRENNDLKRENSDVHHLLMIARQRTYDLMNQKADFILPKLQTLSLKTG